MKPALLGTKIGMTRIPGEKGVVTPVTVVQAGPCTVLQVKTKDKDGYDAVQLGYVDVKPHRSTMALIGHAAKAGTGPKRFAREVRLDEPSDVAAGQVLTVDLFEGGTVNFVDVTATSKGRGTMGVMRRHHFGGLPASHGTERKHRSPGGIGSSAPRGRGRAIKKGKRMPGRMGNVRTTARNQKLVAVDKERNLLLIKGAVPGANGGLVYVQKSVTKG
ncbi:MAG TPA: 50S ribosomal protein L3 [Phycisphaerae bacterium]|jgi:large subunit ribosomal protein L3